MGSKVRSTCAMRIHRLAVVSAIGVAGLGAALHETALAQTYPERPIRLVVPWPAGGITDSAGRLFAQRLAERMGNPVVVDNKAGAAATIGAEHVANAAPDGYTLLLASAETHAIAQHMRAKMPYDAHRQFVAIAPFAVNPFAIVSNAGFAPRDLAALIEAARAAPGRITYSSAGLGSTSQLAMEIFRGHAGIDLLHIPFQGQAPAMVSLLGGQTDLQMLPAGSAASQLKGGKLRVFAVTTRERYFGLPDIPTLRELGLPDMDIANWFGIVAPAGLPSAVLQRLVADAGMVARADETRQALRALGVDSITPMDPSRFAAFMIAESERWGAAIRASGLKPQ